MNYEKEVMRKRLHICFGIFLIATMVLNGCMQYKVLPTEIEGKKQENAVENVPVKEAENEPEVMPEEIEKKTKVEEDEKAATKEAEVVAEDREPDGAVLDETLLQQEETLGDPRSSFGLGSAKYLKGKNLLLSFFVDTPQSCWSEEEQLQILDKVGKAVDFIEKQAESYQIETELLYDFVQYPDLKKETAVDFLIQEDVDFLDRLDEEIAFWQEEILCYEEMEAKYEADGIAAMIFVNNPGISYAIVYDGTDSKKETMILFAEDYYQTGKAETATAYAHEILHVFGAHDLYEDAEFTKEVSDYVALTYPREIMYTVTQSGKEIDSVLSPITAYHLGWIDDAEDITLFPQLIRE